MFSLAVFVSAMLDPRPSRSGAAAGRAHSDDGCDHLSYARARPHTIGSSLFGVPTGITVYLLNGGLLEYAQQMAAHESARTTKLYDRRNDQVTLDQVERIVL
jgi:hypothetical protein